MPELQSIQGSPEYQAQPGGAKNPCLAGQVVLSEDCFGNRMKAAGESPPRAERRRSESFRQKDCCRTSLWRDPDRGAPKEQARRPLVKLSGKRTEEASTRVNVRLFCFPLPRLVPVPITRFAWRRSLPFATAQARQSRRPAQRRLHGQGKTTPSWARSVTFRVPAAGRRCQRRTQQMAIGSLLGNRRRPPPLGRGGGLSNLPVPLKNTI